jgi:hypothetical protein
VVTRRAERYVKKHFDVSEAEQDWRDLLVGAGLANDDWLTVLHVRLGPAVD